VIEYQVVLSISVQADTAAEALLQVQGSIIQRGMQGFVYLVSENGDAEQTYFVDGVGNRLSFDEVKAMNEEAEAARLEEEDYEDEDYITTVRDISEIDEEAEAAAVAESLAG
jgi:hypothetical protein